MPERGLELTMAENPSFTAPQERRCRVLGYAMGQAADKSLQLTVRYQELKAYGALGPESVVIVHDMTVIRKLRETDLTEPVSMAVLGLA
jgi:hypothetical protein